MSEVAKTTRWGGWIALACAGVLVASTVTAQSLAAVARQEQARREALKVHGRLYTNADLQPAEGGDASSQASAEPADSTAAADAKKADAAKADASKTDAAASKKDARKDEAYWHKRITDARSRLAQDQLLAEAMQSRINALLAEFTARDDPEQRAVIESNRLKALAELTRLQKQVEDDTKAINDIQDEARRAGVPPGWLR
ncbi:MAG: hypothetical protein KGN76_14575 [Acidobacteriota bacterium]|nr:hypothetical protein [Acidobacteriota bacterium]